MQVAHYANHQPPSSHKSRKLVGQFGSTREMPPQLALTRPRAGTTPSPDSMPRVQAIEDAVHKELATINGQEELFLRSTSELSMMLRDISHEHGRSYFRYVLREVFGEKSLIYRGPSAHHDIVAYAQSIVKRLARAIHFAPLVLRASTQYVMREFQKEFPDCECSERIVVGSVLFLRILCPALIKPEVFGFEPHSAKSLPTGIQIAKLLQNALRGNLCGPNQPDSAASNHFITTFHPFIETFLTRFPQLATNMRDLHHPTSHFTRVASWDELETSRSNPEMPMSCRSDADDANRLRGMSMSTPDDMSQRKKKFSLKFW